MSENKIQDNSDSFQVDDSPVVAQQQVHEAEVDVLSTLSDEQKRMFDETKKSVSEYERSADFLFSMPNVMRGITVDFEALSDAQKAELQKDTKMEPLLKAEKEAELYLLKTQSKCALLFSAKEVPLQGDNMKKFLPLHVPSMRGRAKIVLVHEDTWKVLQKYSFVVEHHPSATERELSDVYAVHAFSQNGAEVSYLETITCSRCAAAPAPFRCYTCEIPYCSTVCRSAHKEQHDAQCLTTLMSHMKVTVENARKNFNVNSKQFEAEQKEFWERNKGKLVTVRRIDHDGKVISETKEIVVPSDS